MTLLEKLQSFIYKTAWIWLFLFTLAVFAFAIYIKIDVWYECRIDHSFFYCFSLISK